MGTARIPGHCLPSECRTVTNLPSPIGRPVLRGYVMGLSDFPVKQQNVGHYQSQQPQAMNMVSRNHSTSIRYFTENKPREAKRWRSVSVNNI